MYSVVLLMALSGGAEAPDCHRHSCSGSSACSGGYAMACTGGYGGCTGGYASCSGSSCHGGGHKLFGGHGGRSCHGGGGLFGGHKGGHGCHGGYESCHGGYGCTGGGYMGCTGGYGGGYMGCTGGAYMGCAGGAYMEGGMAPPPPPAGEKLPKPKEKETKPKEEVNAPATIVLSLPADAKVAIDGVLTSSTSATRTFVTPELAPAKEFVYTLTAEIVRDGRTLKASEQVTVRAGEETRISFGSEKFSTLTVAAK